MKDIRINQTLIGKKHPAYIIAELSGNHQQKIEVALKSIEAIAETGANAIKAQVYKPDTISCDSNNKHFQVKNTELWDGTTMYKLYEQAYTPWDWMPKLQEKARACGLDFFASAFDPSSTDLLASLDVPAYKVASFEIHDLPLISYMAKQQKPMIISTGIASKADIQAAIKKVGNSQIILLKCTSAYPTPLEDLNLNSIELLRSDFKLLTGLSDHSSGHLAATLAIALGAVVVEKHFILDRSLGGPDAAFSLNKQEFTELVTAIRESEKALGSATYTLTQKQKSMKVFGRSLFVVKDMQKGEVFTKENVRSIRPADGLPPKELPNVLGKKATRSIEKGTPLSFSLITK